MNPLIAFVVLKIVIDSVEFQGVKFFPHSKLYSFARKELPLPADRPHVESFITQVLKIYADNGYPLASIEPVGIKVREDSTGILILKIDEGSLVVIESVAVEGLGAKIGALLAETVWPQTPDVFRQSKFDDRIGKIQNVADIELSSVSFVKFGHNYILKLKVSRSQGNSVLGTATYEKRYGLMGLIDVRLTDALGGLRTLVLRWNREGPTSQMLHIELTDPVLLGEWLGAHVSALYEATDLRVMEAVDFGLQKWFMNADAQIYAGVHYESGEVREHAMTWGFSYKFLKAKGEQSRHRMRLTLGLKSEIFRHKRFSISGMQEYRDVERWGMPVLSQDKFRLGGPSGFKGVRPGEIVVAECVWTGFEADYDFGGLVSYAFANYGLFDSQTIFRTGIGLRNPNIDISIAFPTKLITLSLAYRF